MSEDEFFERAGIHHIVLDNHIAQALGQTLVGFDMLTEIRAIGTSSEPLFALVGRRWRRTPLQADCRLQGTCLRHVLAPPSRAIGRVNPSMQRYPGRSNGTQEGGLAVGAPVTVAEPASGRPSVI
jgi:hypothetical protein